MASIILASAGSAIGAGIGGSILGVSAATIGGAVGTLAGAAIDSWIAAALTPGQRIEGPRLETLTVTTATEGAVVPRVHGRMRTGGNIIWATDFAEEVRTSRQGGGKGGGGGGATVTEYLYSASFAVGLCEGPIAGVGRIWADGKPMDLEGVVYRVHLGTEDQAPDPFIEATMGAGNAPAYRGTAYVVFEGLALARYGNRLPQLAFEVIRPLAGGESVETLARAVTLIPATGEFAYASEVIRSGGSGTTRAENVHNTRGLPDLVVALDQLETALPEVGSVSLVVAWFGTDLRAGSCAVKPGVELATKATSPKSWSVNGVSRAGAQLVSRDAEGRPAYGGTPADFAVVQAIQELKARGLRVTFYPFLLMDIPAGNTLADPYSNDAAGIGQPAHPWRGRITCAPAPGYAGSVDRTAAAADQVAAFFGAAQPADFAVAGENVSWTGPAGDWGYRRMVLHYAHLCAAAGGVDAFLIGSELRGLTQVRDGAASYPAVAALRVLAQDCRAVLGAGTKIGYAADWSEYFGHHPAPAELLAGGVFDDPAAGAHWTQSPVNAAVIDYTAAGLELTPASTAFADRAQAYQRVATVAGAVYEIRVSVTEVPAGSFGLYCLPYDSAAGLALIGSVADYQVAAPGEHFFTFTAPSTSTDLYVRLTGTTGTVRIAMISLKPAAGDVRFHLDPLWADPAIDFVGIDNYMPLADWRDGADHLDSEAGSATGSSDPPNAGWASIHDRGYLEANIEGGEGFDWYYASEADRAAQLRTPISDGAYGKPWIFRYKDLRSWWANPHHERLAGIESASATAWVPESKPIRFTELGCPALDRGANQPNAFVDPKSAESTLPRFSRGWRDDAMQRRFLEAQLGYWAEPARNPVSAVYGGPMLETAETALWTWDARPFPDFPAREDAWADAGNWQLGHWLTGRLGAAPLAALVVELCTRAGLPADWVDASALAEAVPGHLITALESPRASLAPLARYYGFDAVESGGAIRFLPRGRAAVATLDPDALLAGEGGAEGLELARAQETELPVALKWQLMRADAEYEALTVEARRLGDRSAQVAGESFPLAADPGDADRRCRRALNEAWAGRETARFRLPPSRLALDPGDVVELGHDGRSLAYRLAAIADAGARTVEATRADPALYDLAPGAHRPAALPGAVVFGAPVAAFLDLPQLTEEMPPHQPLLAVHAHPWYGTAAAWRSTGQDDFTLNATTRRAARMGALAADLYPGPTSRFDHGNVAIVDLFAGTLESVTDAALLGGANTLALEAAPGVWEVLQFGTAELLAPGRYRLTRLLRGQRGRGGAVGAPPPAYPRVVVLDPALVPLGIAEAELGLAFTWAIGPAARPVSDPAYLQLSFAAAGRGLMPFAVGHVRQPWRRARSPGDLEIAWTRRSRALAGDGWTAPEVPLAEEAEAYEVEVLDGAAVLRTLATGEPRVTYTGADQAADWGRLLAPGDALAVRIFQLSARVGRGAPKSVTLYL